MNLIDLLQNHACEASCKNAFKAHRELLGVTCKKCYSTNQHWSARKNFWRCGNCNFKTTLRSGTALQHTKMPFLIWFQVVALMSSTTKGFSAREIQIQMKHKRYEPIWYMMHKIRTQMGKNVMFIDAFENILTGYISGILEHTEDKKKEFVTKEIQLETLNFRGISQDGREKYMKGVRMRLIKSELNANKEMKVTRRPINQTYGSQPESLKSDRKIKNSARSSRFALKCLDNVKRVLYGIHHQVKCEYLQNYLDEFCYKFNRKETDEFSYDEIWQQLIITKK